MIPNGRRAWRKWVRRQDLRRKHKQPKGSVCRMARQARRHLPLVPGVVLPKPLTTRSFVGMSQSARKRAARIACVGHRFRSRRLKLVWFKGWARDICGRIATESDKATITRYQEARAKYRISERLRQCPGCCACWGHRISSAYGEIAECCGPQTSGKRKSQIKAMRKWQETLADNCDGSGVLPARRS